MKLFSWLSRDKSVSKSIDDFDGERGWSSVGGSSAGQVSVRAYNTQIRALSPSECFELTHSVNCAVNAIARNIKKAKPRLFTRSGREITGGPLFDILKSPAPGVTYRQWIEQIICWRNIAGEWAVNVKPGPRYPEALHVLNPTPGVLDISLPARCPKTFAEIVQWRYRHNDGAQEYIRSDYLIYEGLFNPNHATVRGLSPLIAGSVTASTQYQIGRYNLGFFQNGAIPSHIVVLPDKVTKSQREDFERRYIAEFSNYANNAHKVMVVAGKDARIEKISESEKEGGFLELSKWNDEKIGQLYRVPPIEMFNLQKTRFDTANEERKMFLESCLMPQMEDISAILQSQLVDRFYRFSDYTTEKPRMSRSMGAMLEKAMTDRSESPILFLIDPDTLPIMGDVKLLQMEYGEKFRDTFNASAWETAQWLGVDVEETEEKKDVWIKNDRLNITHPEMNAKLVPGVKPSGDSQQSGKSSPSAEGASKSTTTTDGLPIDPSLTKQLTTILRKLRRLTLDAIDAGGMWSLAEGDALAGDDQLKPAIRRVRHELRRAIKGAADPKAAAKSFFNRADARTFLDARQDNP